MAVTTRGAERQTANVKHIDEDLYSYGNLEGINLHMKVGGPPAPLTEEYVLYLKRAAKRQREYANTLLLVERVKMLLLRLDNAPQIAEEYHVAEAVLSGAVRADLRKAVGLPVAGKEST